MSERTRVRTASILGLAVLVGGCAVTRALPRTIDGLTGPRIGNGNSTEAIDEFPLGEELPGLAGLQMRARYVLAKPGGHIRIHDHSGRPAFSYVVTGPVIEYRSDGPADGIPHAPGALTADSNIAQWWENDSNETARWFVVDIYRRGGDAGE